MIEYKLASKDDLEQVMESRLEMLRDVNDLPADYEFSEELVSCSRAYFEAGQQTTVLALDGRTVGCAALCYIEMMPTFSHPTGKRAHLMNVYTAPSYRGQGIARRMVELLIREAKERGVTEISLDATEAGRPLYEKCGFTASEECMMLVLNQKKHSPKN